MCVCVCACVCVHIHHLGCFIIAQIFTVKFWTSHIFKKEGKEWREGGRKEGRKKEKGREMLLLRH